MNEEKTCLLCCELCEHVLNAPEGTSFIILAHEDNVFSVSTFPPEYKDLFEEHIKKIEEKIAFIYSGIEPH